MDEITSPGHASTGARAKAAVAKDRLFMQILEPSTGPRADTRRYTINLIFLVVLGSTWQYLVVLASIFRFQGRPAEVHNNIFGGDW